MKKKERKLVNKQIVLDWNVIFSFEEKSRFGNLRSGSKSRLFVLFRSGWNISIVSPERLRGINSYFLLKHLYLFDLSFIEVIPFLERNKESAVYISFDWFCFVMNAQWRKLWRRLCEMFHRHLQKKYFLDTRSFVCRFFKISGLNK